MTKTKKMHDNQIQNLINLSAEERYEFFIRYCADFEEVWGLTVGEDNWVVFKDYNGDEIFPIWPHADLAESCCFDEHKDLNAKPQLMKLDSFMKNCIPDMISANVYFGIFFNHKREGLTVDGVTLKNAIEEEVKSVWE